jgi:hypothetical protein
MTIPAPPTASFTPVDRSAAERERELTDIAAIAAAQAARAYKARYAGLNECRRNVPNTSRVLVLA